MRGCHELTERELDEVSGGDCGFGVCVNPFNAIAMGLAKGAADAGATLAAVQKVANAIAGTATHPPT